eukprot:TRINITY_DN1825_c0_g1_i1.p1 TRINITY_DN1825_c0_g1~~TRINITY_DN1825_c0_g1_i1.p1  ORF type:complete len:316 (+),score=57.75 TRINITY_DN1825_c0_g1_i1:122-949(+)
MSEMSAINDALRSVITARTKEAAKAMEDQRVVQEAAQAKARANGHIASIHVGRGGSSTTGGRGSPSALSPAKVTPSLGAVAGLGIGSLSANGRSKSSHRDGVAAVAVSGQSTSNGLHNGEQMGDVTSEQRESKKDNCSTKDKEGKMLNGKQVEEKMGETSGGPSVDCGTELHEEAVPDESSPSENGWDVETESRKAVGGISLALDEKGASLLARICQKRREQYPSTFDDKLSTAVGKAQPPLEEIIMASRARSHELAILQRAIERGVSSPQATSS